VLSEQPPDSTPAPARAQAPARASMAPFGENEKKIKDLARLFFLSRGKQIGQILVTRLDIDD